MVLLLADAMPVSGIWPAALGLICAARTGSAAMGAGTGREGKALKVSGGAFLEGKGPCTKEASCPSGCATCPVKMGSSAKRVRPCWGVEGPADPAAVSDCGLEKALGIHDPAFKCKHLAFVSLQIVCAMLNMADSSTLCGSCQGLEGVQYWAWL